MIEVHGKIIAIHGETAKVAIEQDAHCAGCASRKTCHGGSGAAIVEIRQPEGMLVGERVSLGMAESTLTRSALLAYLLPPACLITGAGLADTLAHSDAVAMLGALLGLLAGLGIARAMTRLFNQESLQPSISPCTSHATFQHRSPAP